MIHFSLVVRRMAFEASGLSCVSREVTIGIIQNGQEWVCGTVFVLKERRVWLQVSRGVSPLPVAVKCRRRYVRVRAACGLAPALRAGHDEYLSSWIEIEFKFIGCFIGIPLIGTVPEGIREFTRWHGVSKICLDMDDFDVLSG